MNGEKFKVGQGGSHGTCHGTCRGINLISQRNELVRASYQLRLDELRLVLLAASKIDSRGLPLVGRDGDAVSVAAAEWAETFEISMNNSYSQLRRAAQGLWGREITRVAGQQRDDLRWLWRKSEHPAGGGKVILYFSPGVLHYFQDLGGGFTRYRLSRIANFHSIYSIRIFQLCAQFMRTGVVRVTLTDLHEMLQSPASYRRRFSDFERFVLAPAVHEIGHTSSISIKYGRRDGLIEFSFDADHQLFLRRPLL